MTIIEIQPNDINDSRLKSLRKLFIDFYEYSYKSFDPNIELHLPDNQTLYQWLEYTFDKVENNLCNNINQQNRLWHCYAIKSSETLNDNDNDNYIAFIIIKDEKEYNSIYFAQYAVKNSNDRSPMIELLHYVQSKYPEQKMVGVGRRISQIAAQFFINNGAKIIENDQTIAIRHGYDPKDYVAFQYY